MRMWPSWLGCVTRTWMKCWNNLPFRDDDEKQRVCAAIKLDYNGLRFFWGAPLYHIGTMNRVMQGLLVVEKRQDWLNDLEERAPFCPAERAPTSVFHVVKTARNLRPIVNTLVATGEETGYSLNQGLSLWDLIKKDINVDDYLTLLVHFGILSVTWEDRGVFRCSSGAYRNDHLEALLSVVKVSLNDLLKRQSAQQVYEKGEPLISDFLSTLSATSMSALVEWVTAFQKNNFMELPLQEFLVGELHALLYNRDKGATETQDENVFPSKKSTDITLSWNNVLIILDFKKGTGAWPPIVASEKEYHDELRGYVEERKKMEQTFRRRHVAGFLVVMYNDGMHYLVERIWPNYRGCGARIAIKNNNMSIFISSRRPGKCCS